MKFSLKEFEKFVSKVDAKLKNTESITSFDANICYDKDKINALIEKATENGANVYAIWSREPKSDKCTVKYIGQRSVKDIRGRLMEHLWNKSDSTYSKLKEVRSEWDENNDIGISTVLIEPDSLRHAVEVQLICNNTKGEVGLPWNKQERKK